VNVAFYLRRRPEGRRAAAVLIPGRDAATVLGFCARAGLDPSGRVFPVAGGFVVVLDDPTTRPLPGAVRLRALADNLYVPADSELVPALLDDEAAGLTRDRALVFLPGGRLLRFEPLSPVPLTDLLKPPARVGRDWRSLPEPPPLADRIEEIVLDRPDETPESLLGGGDAGPIGTEPPRPDESGHASTLLGRAALGAGKGIARLGGALGSGALSALGAKLMSGAVRLAPRLTEDLLGRQAAALRELLREFREGDVERALRRSLPIGGPSDRGSDVYNSDRLPPRDISYGLNTLLTGGFGQSSRWLGGADVMAELTREYHKAAEEALRRGDFRRAAAIYGKLLNDFRSAANALLRGGLYHDAAVLFLARLDDRRAAARAFESGGEFDRAVALYREIGDRAAAGDLLRKLGEDEEALAEYVLAAEHLAATAPGHLAAGNLLFTKAGRPDLALIQFAAGWVRRPAANAVSCALRIVELHAASADLPALRTILEEAESFFATAADPSEAGRFYNEVAATADRPPLVAAREELRDRALMGLAGQLRRGAQPGVPAGRLVSNLLGARGVWPDALVSDAAFAASAATRPDAVSGSAGRDASGVWRLRVGTGVVSAVAGAQNSGAVFLGFERGEVYCFRPERSEVIAVATYDLPVASLATDPEGEHLVVLRAHPRGRGVVSAYARQPDGSYKLMLGMPLDDLAEPWLTPVLRSPVGHAFGLWDGQTLNVLEAGNLAIAGRLSLNEPAQAPSAGLLFDIGGEPDWPYRVFIHDGWQWSLFDSRGELAQKSGVTWRPATIAQSPLRSSPLCWSGNVADDLVLAGLDATGTLHWSRVHEGNVIAGYSAGTPGGYMAAAVVRDDLVAAVGRGRVEWLRCGANRFNLWRTTDAAVPHAVASFDSPQTGELVIVCSDGFVARLSIPGR
jgi:tetratricopeptide (TPR) repeat protein